MKMSKIKVNSIEDLEIKLQSARNDVELMEAFFIGYKNHLFTIGLAISMYEHDKIELMEVFTVEHKFHCKAVADILGVP